MDTPVRMYRMTQGQASVLAAAKEVGGSFVVYRLWSVLESLFVDPVDWHRMDKAIVTGELDLPDALKFLEKVAKYDWDTELAKASPFREDVEESEREVPATFSAGDGD